MTQTPATEPGPNASLDPAGHPPIRRPRWVTGLAQLLLSTVLCIVLAELAFRAFWYFGYDVPFTHPSRILYAYYPELKEVDEKRPAHGDGFYDILLLGGSTLNPEWGVVPQVLAETLAYAGHRNVRIFNLAMPAQTSRDSWLKYAALPQARFDLVVAYDGFNEARANNAPPKVYRGDYSHYGWYEVVNMLARYHGSSWFALPYTLHYLVIRARQVVLPNHYIPFKGLHKGWARYGRWHRSVAAFKRNLEAILAIAAQRGDRMLLMTVATYAPENYSLGAFYEQRLDYGLHLLPFEQWGRKEDVLKTVALENELVRNEAARHEGVLFVDQARLMPGPARYFNDPCHLTVVGSTKFVENLLPVLLPTLQAR